MFVGFLTVCLNLMVILIILFQGIYHMTTEQDYQKIKNYSLQALAHLEQYTIPPEPKLYEVWYQYVLGDNIEITKAIHEFLTKGGVPDKNFTEKLHALTLSYDVIARTVDSVTTMLNEQLSYVTGAMSGTDIELSSFGKLLDNFTAKISSGTIPEGLVEKITSATEKVSNKIKNLETNLEMSQSEIRRLQHYLETVRQESNIDPLTALATRKRYDQALAQAVRNAVEMNEELSVTIFEVDHYAAFRGKWGQVTAEQILRFIGGALKENIKGRDTAARYSGDTFALILPKTESSGAKILMEHIRHTVESKRIVKKTTGEFLGRVTLSIGIAQYKKGDSVGHFLSKCERSLGAARDNGRNCTMTENDADAILSNNSHLSGMAS